jgi:hypothetical protein
VVLERLDKALLAAAAKVNITQVVEAAQPPPGALEEIMEMLMAARAFKTVF